MTFAHPLYLRIGAGLVLLVLLGLWSHMRRRRKLAAFLGGARAAARLSGTNLYRPRLERALLLSAAAVAVALAAAGPAFPDREPPPPPAPPTRDVVFVIDVSASMQAVDERPTRLGRAVALIEDEILPTLEGDRVGLVLYAGTAYPIAPPTHDREAFRYLLGGVGPTLASAWDPGSRPSVGIAEAVRFLEERPDSGTVRTVVLLSDGEAGESTNSIRDAAAEAAAAGITVHAIGVGTTRGSGMTLATGPYQLGGPVVSEDGAPVISRFREAPLREIAETGGGSFVAASDEVGLAAFQANLARPPVPSIPVQPRMVLDRYDPAILFAALAILLLLAESLLDVRLPGTGIATARSLARRSI